MNDNKTKPHAGDVSAFIKGIYVPRRRDDAQTLLPLFAEWTGMNPVLWGDGLAGNPGSAIIGYGQYHYKYASGREGDFFLTGFSPRKANMTIYIMPGFSNYAKHLARLGPHKHSVSCLYLTSLDKIDLGVLGEIVKDSMAEMKERHEWKPT